MAIRPFWDPVLPPDFPMDFRGTYVRFSAFNARSFLFSPKKTIPFAALIDAAAARWEADFESLTGFSVLSYFAKLPSSGASVTDWGPRGRNAVDLSSVGEEFEELLEDAFLLPDREPGWRLDFEIDPTQSFRIQTSVEGNPTPDLGKVIPVVATAAERFALRIRPLLTDFSKIKIGRNIMPATHHRIAERLAARAGRSSPRAADEEIPAG